MKKGCSLMELSLQEKAKIGELVKTLEQRSRSIEKLKEELNNMEQRHKQQINVLKKQEKKQIEKIQLDLSNKNQLIAQLQIKIQQLSYQKETKNVSVQCKVEQSIKQTISQSTNTHNPRVKQSITQTRYKQQSVRVQTEAANQGKFHSKAYDKIMNMEETELHQITAQLLKEKMKYINSLKGQFRQLTERESQSNCLEKKSFETKFKEERQQEIIQKQSEIDLMEYQRHSQLTIQASPSWEQSKPMTSFSQQFDDQALNKLLKSKQFSASKLLKREKSAQRLNSKDQNNFSMNEMNHYNSELLDLVDSLHQ